MREIKFRQRLKLHFWHKDERFHYWGYIEGCFISPMGKNEAVGDSEQFTGLKDKNGVEIYEGDIVKAYHSEFEGFTTGEVIFKNSTYTIGKYWKDGTHDWTSMEQYEQFDLEVIGNIYENKDLLP